MQISISGGNFEFLGLIILLCSLVCFFVLFKKTFYLNLFRKFSYSERVFVLLLACNFAMLTGLVSGLIESEYIQLFKVPYVYETSGIPLKVFYTEKLIYSQNGYPFSVVVDLVPVFGMAGSISVGYLYLFYIPFLLNCLFYTPFAYVITYALIKRKKDSLLGLIIATIFVLFCIHLFFENPLFFDGFFL